MEVELKLALDPADAGRLRKAAPLARVEPVVTRMDGVYLDTDDCELARNGMALRLRRAGDRWMQALKAGGGSTGGLHARGEWEFEQGSHCVDLARFRDTPLAAIPDPATLHERLHAAFRVTFERTTWTVTRARGSRLEVALDVGHVASTDGSQPICEVEIECLEGGAEHAFDLAELLMDEATLRPSGVTKAMRGYRLFRHEPLSPVRARDSGVRKGMTANEAARAIVAASLAQLQANEEGLLESDDPEFVHQARVAMRRIRSALRMFRKAIGRARADKLRKALGRATTALGAARDWDVFMNETLPALPAPPEVIERARRRQSRARAAARKAVRSRGYALAILRLSRWLAVGARDKGGNALDDFAARLLSRRHDRLVRDLAGLENATMAARHQTRIDAKRLRYAVEGIAPALDRQAARRYSRLLARLQDALGRANDAVTGRALLAKLGPDPALEAFAHDWLAARIADETKDIAASSLQVIGFKPFWDQA